MSTSLWQLLNNNTVVIPILQRDYAQGRSTGPAPLIRERFLSEIFAHLIPGSKVLELDFVYGYQKQLDTPGGTLENRFVPLDGQQRLTTLFLLHWYVAVKENRLPEASPALAKFGYETRHSSRVFCRHLVTFVPGQLQSSIKETIIDQPWFFTAWKADPTIDSMLTMLDAIQEKFLMLDNPTNVWDRLTSDEPPVVFHLLPMESLGLPDELYIKMNSRGKELTPFEHFKSRFSEILHPEDAETFNHKIDQDWSDTFWELHRDSSDRDIARQVDKAFMRFFNYVTDILIYRDDLQLTTSVDDFDRYAQVYSNRNCVEMLFNYLDAASLCSQQFTTSLFYTQESDFAPEKVRLFFQAPNADLFRKCAQNYDSGSRAMFSIGEQLLLFACLEHLVHNSEELPDRLRKLRNLIANSEDTVRYDNMSSLLYTTEDLINTGSINHDNRFNRRQVEEEEEKELFKSQYPEFRETVNQLEDHTLLQGCLAIFTLDATLSKYAEAFFRLFNSGADYESINRALLSIGDYSQEYDAHKKRLGKKHAIWRELLTPSQRRHGFENTREILHGLFDMLTDNPHLDLSQIPATFLGEFAANDNKPRSWPYYYLKYHYFNLGEDGFMWWADFNAQYNFFALNKSQRNGFHWSPFLFTIKQLFPRNLTLEEYGDPLALTVGDLSLKITNVSNGLKLESINEEGAAYLADLASSGYIDAENVLAITQDADGVDVEDRIEKGVEFVKMVYAKEPSL